jgi:LysM repeat protein
MKKIFFLLFLLPLFTIAQEGKKDIIHTVGPKENLSSIGRMYNINGRELAAYNNINYEKGLSIGQKLKIPPKNTNTDVLVPPPPAKKITEAKPVEVPLNKGEAIYHTVEKRQTLYTISKLYNVTVADIKKWNKLTADGLNEGSKIIVGYKSTKNGVDTKAKVISNPPAEKINTKVIEPEKEENTQIKISDEKKQGITPVTAKEETQTVTIGKGTAIKESFFKTDYEMQTSAKNVVSETGIVGIFKSSSGWSDGKFYCLHNTAQQGTIIKITNTANGKSVYAKVLDLIPDIKQNNGLLIRLSNAAADVLGLTETKIDCTLSYSK